MNYENASFLKQLWLTYDENIDAYYKLCSDYVEFRVPYKQDTHFKYLCYEDYTVVIVSDAQKVTETCNCFSQEQVLEATLSYMDYSDQYRMRKAFEPIDSNEDTAGENKKKTKTKRILIFAALFCAVVLIGLGIHQRLNGPIVITQATEELVYGESYTAEQLATSDSNVHLSVAGFDDCVVIDEVGEISLDVVGTRGEQTEKQTFTYKVVDKTPPTISFHGEPTIRINGSENDIINALDDLAISDNVDGKIDAENVTIEGDYNLNVGGKYYIKVVAFDKSDNSVGKNTTLTVDDGSISWDKAIDHVGQQAVVRGPLQSVAYKYYVYGSPTFINVGRDYPDSDRFQAVIWGENLSGDLAEKAEELYDEYIGATIEIKGTIDIYDGVAEIIVKDADQLIFPTNW
ncbi:MAG: hypothetical protein K6B42_02895 [Clostridia bacterium]|nr:hypothetical protein [Clostridia bacterium]